MSCAINQADLEQVRAWHPRAEQCYEKDEGWGCAAVSAKQPPLCQASLHLVSKRGLRPQSPATPSGRSPDATCRAYPGRTRMALALDTCTARL